MFEFDKHSNHLPPTTGTPLSSIPEGNEISFEALDLAITQYVTNFIKAPLSDHLKSLVLRNICQLSEDEILSSPQCAKIKEIREYCFICFEKQNASGSSGADNSYLNVAKAANYVPHPLFEVVSHLGSNKASIPCEAATVTALSTDIGMIRTTNGLNIIASSIGVIKTIKDGVHYFYEKVRILQLKAKIAALQKPQNYHSLQAQIEINTLQTEVAGHQAVICKIKKNALPDAYLNSTYFTGSVAGAVLDPTMLANGMTLSSAAITTGAIVSASFAGVAFGVGMLGINIKKIVTDIKKGKKLKRLEKNLLAKKDRSSPRLKKIIDLKLAYIKTHNRKKLAMNHLTHSLNSAVGFFSVSSGVVSILVATGVVVGTAAILATGIGLAVAIGVTASVCIGIAIYKYCQKRKKMQSEKDVANCQVVIIALEAKINKQIHDQHGISQDLIDDYHKQNMELETLKAHAALNLRGVDKSALVDILTDFDTLSVEDLPEIEKMLGIIYEYSPDELTRRQMAKQAMTAWIKSDQLTP